MLSAGKMSQDIRFEQRWEFRSRESESSDDTSGTSSSSESVLKKQKLKFLTNGNKPSGDDYNSSSSNAPVSKKHKLDFQNKENESTSHGSKSSPSGRRVLKKHKLVADLIAVQHDEHEFRTEVKDRGDIGTRNRNQSKRTNRRTGMNKRKISMISKRGRDFCEDTSRIKSNNETYESTNMDDLNMFRKSIIEELKVGRQNIFDRMKEEMHEVLADDYTSTMTRKESAEGKEIQLYGKLSVENVQLKQKKSLVKDMDINPRSGVQPILIQYSRRRWKDVSPQHQKCSLEKIKTNQPVAIANTDGTPKLESSGKTKSTFGFLGGPVQRRELLGSVVTFRGLANEGHPRHFIGSYLSPRITTKRRVVVLGLSRNPTFVIGSSIRTAHFRPSKLTMILGVPCCSDAPLQNSGNSNRPLGSYQHRVPENRVRIRINNVNTPITLMKKDNGQESRVFSTMNSFNRSSNLVASSTNVSSPAVFRETHSKNCRARASFDPAKVKAALDPSSIILALSSPLRCNSRKQQEGRIENFSGNRRISFGLQAGIFESIPHDVT